MTEEILKKANILKSKIEDAESDLKAWSNTVYWSLKYSTGPQSHEYTLFKSRVPETVWQRAKEILVTGLESKISTLQSEFDALGEGSNGRRY